VRCDQGAVRSEQPAYITRLNPPRSAKANEKIVSPSIRLCRNASDLGTVDFVDRSRVARDFWHEKKSRKLADPPSNSTASRIFGWNDSESRHSRSSTRLRSGRPLLVGRRGTFLLEMSPIAPLGGVWTARPSRRRATHKRLLARARSARTRVQHAKRNDPCACRRTRRAPTRDEPDVRL